MATSLGEPGPTASQEGNGGTGTSGVGVTYSAFERKRRAHVFFEKCKTHGGFLLGERNTMMASGCGRTCLPDAILTLEAHLKAVFTLSAEHLEHLALGAPAQADRALAVPAHVRQRILLEETIMVPLGELLLPHHERTRFHTGRHCEAL